MNIEDLTRTAIKYSGAVNYLCASVEAGLSDEDIVKILIKILNELTGKKIERKSRP